MLIKNDVNYFPCLLPDGRACIISRQIKATFRTDRQDNILRNVGYPSSWDLPFAASLMMSSFSSDSLIPFENSCNGQS